MERSYTESEIRQRISDNIERIIQELRIRLQIDDVFKMHSFTLKGKLNPDGSVSTSNEDLEPLRRIVSDTIGVILKEYLDTILTIVFRDY